MIENCVIGRKGFVVKVSDDLKSVFVAEVYSGLGVLLFILQAWKIIRSIKKFKFKLASYYKSTLHIFDTGYRIITMTAKLSSIIREIIAAKKECISHLIIVKVSTYQDEVK